MLTSQSYKVVKRTSFVSATVNTLLAIFKIIVGHFGHSTALLADGIHSFSDLISDALVLIAAKVGAKYPDASHPYGHHRIETIASIIIALALLAVGSLIIYDATTHFIHKTVLYQPSILVMVVAIISIVANEYLFRYTLKAGKSVHSNLLITNAWHNRSDVYVSIIVVVSVLGAWLGYHYFDLIGAVIVAFFILKMGAKMIWDSTNELIDAAVDKETLEKIHAVIEKIPGVTSIHQLRTRLHGASIFLDVHIIVDGKISVSEGHHISQHVHTALQKQLSNIADVTVHVDPEDDETCMPSLHLPSRSELRKQLDAHWKDLPSYPKIKDLQLHYLDGKLQLTLFMPLSILETSDGKSLEKQYQNAAKSLRDIEDIQLYFG